MGTGCQKCSRAKHISLLRRKDLFILPKDAQYFCDWTGNYPEIGDQISNHVLIHLKVVYLTGKVPSWCTFKYSIASQILELLK